MCDIKIEGLYTERDKASCRGCLLYDKDAGEPFYGTSICSNILLKLTGRACIREGIIFKKKPLFKRLNEADTVSPGDEVYIGDSIENKFIVEFDLDRRSNKHEVVIRNTKTDTQSINSITLFSKLV